MDNYKEKAKQLLISIKNLTTFARIADLAELLRQTAKDQRERDAVIAETRLKDTGKGAFYTAGQCIAAAIRKGEA